jgi:hypothetical protein
MPGKATASPEIVPWFAPRDYAEHRVLDSTLPATFDEWLADAEAAGGPPHVVRKIVIHAGEFARWCDAEKRPPNAAARIDFAIQAMRRPVRRV